MTDTTTTTTTTDGAMMRIPISEWLVIFLLGSIGYMPVEIKSVFWVALWLFMLILGGPRSGLQLSTTTPKQSKS